MNIARISPTRNFCLFGQDFYIYDEEDIALRQAHGLLCAERRAYGWRYYNLYVEEAYRRRGIATELFKQMALMTPGHCRFTSNLDTPYRALYEKVGFTIDPERSFNGCLSWVNHVVDLPDLDLAGDASLP